MRKLQGTWPHQSRFIRTTPRGQGLVDMSVTAELNKVVAALEIRLPTAESFVVRVVIIF